MKPTSTQENSSIGQSVITGEDWANVMLKGQLTVTFLSDGGSKINVFPVVRDCGIYRVLGPTAELEGKYLEPKVGTRLPPMPLSRYKGRELALIHCQLFGDAETRFFIDYRKRAREAIIESNLNMGRPRGYEACVKEIEKENELHIDVHNGKMAILGLAEAILELAEEEKARLGEARFNELELIIHEMEFYREEMLMNRQRRRRRRRLEERLMEMGTARGANPWPL
jgi:hypothetical protein